MKNLLELINHHESFKSDILGLYKEFCSSINSERGQISFMRRRCDKNFEKQYGFKKKDWRYDESNICVRIKTRDFGKSVAEWHGITEKQLSSVGYNYSTFGYEIAKIYINDPNFQNGEYDPRGDIMFIRHINSCPRKGGVSYSNAHKRL